MTTNTSNSAVDEPLPGKIVRVRPKWMDGWANRPTLEAQVTPFKEADALWEVQQDLYRSQIGDVVHRMYTDGKPTHGFGGAAIHLNMTDGTSKDFVGAWSSNASAVSHAYPDKPCTECSICTSNDIWERGYTFSGRDIDTRALLDWWFNNQKALDWGLAIVKSPYGSIDVEPTRRQFVKVDGSGTTPEVLGIIYPPASDSIFHHTKESQVNFFFALLRDALRMPPEGGDQKVSSQQNTAIQAV